MNTPRLFSSLLLAAALPLAGNLSKTYASDHGDGPTVAGDQACDLADLYMFRDPSDPTKIVILNTVRGFIVPGESGNFGIFDSDVKYRFQVENSDDAKPDAFIDVQFSHKISADPQVATVKFSGAAFDGINTKGKYTGNSSFVGPTAVAADLTNYFPTTPQKLKDKDGVEIGVEFFAGIVDDPFFFDIPGFQGFVKRALAGDPTAAQAFNRGRDTFAGYNVMVIAFRMDFALLQSTKSTVTNKVIGINVQAQRASERTAKGEKVSGGVFTTVDRQGNPGINALLVPLAFKERYNGQTTIDDTKPKSSEPIVATLKALGISDENLAVLAGIVAAKGDFLRINPDVPTAFGVSGRKPSDDVVDIVLTIVAGGTLSDNANANDVPFATTFPYIGLPQLPRDNGVIDDNTRN